MTYPMLLLAYRMALLGYRMALLGYRMPDATACLLVCLLGRPPVDLLGWSPGDASSIAYANIILASKRLVVVLRPNDPCDPVASAITRSFSAAFAASVASALQLLISKVVKIGMKYNFC